MSLISNQTLYTDLDPTGVVVGRVLEEGDPEARFVLVAQGSPIPEELAKRYNLSDHESIAQLNESEAHADLAATNRQTYADNARTLGGAFKGLPAEASSTATPTK